MPKKIIVAGAGHGGLVTAAMLAKEGYDVTLFESHGKRNIGYDWEDCASFDVVKKAGADDKISESDFHNVHRMCYYAGSATSAIYSSEDKVGPSAIERRVLLRGLIDHAQNCGVKLKFNVKVLAPILEDGRVVGVETEKGVSRADLVIDAAGINSPLRSQLPAECGIENDYLPCDALHCFRAYFSKNDRYAEPIAPYEIFIYLHGIRGLNWCITNDDYVDILIGRFGQLSQEYIDETLESFRIRRPQLGKTIVRGGERGVIPTRRPLSQMVCDGYAAIGDSAFMTFPMNGSGLDYSMLAGVMLAETILADTNDSFTAETLWSYNYRYIKEMGTTQINMDILKNSLLSFEQSGLDFLFDKGIITQQDLTSCGTEITAADMVNRAIRGVSNLPVLLKTALAISKSDAATKAYGRIPEQYDKAAVDKWKAEVAKYVTEFTPN